MTILVYAMLPGLYVGHKAAHRKREAYREPRCGMSPQLKRENPDSNNAPRSLRNGDENAQSTLYVDSDAICWCICGGI